MRDIPPEFLTDVSAYMTRRVCCLGAVRPDGKAGQFSGALIEDAERYFIATARHCIEPIRDLGKIAVSTFANQHLWLRCTGVVEIQGKMQRQIDVVLLRLEDSFAEELNVDWTTREEMSSRYTGPGAAIAMLGFPAQLSKENRTDRIVVTPGPVAYLTEVTKRESPRFAGPMGAVDKNIHILVEYEAGNVVPGTPTVVPPEHLDPGGMSGCAGFVIPRLVPGKPWDRSKAMLAGIQSVWFAERNMLLLNRAEYLQLLIDKMPKT